MSKLLNPDYEFLDDPDAQFVIKHQQSITDEFLNENHEKRLHSASNKMGDYHQFAAVPTAVIEKWMREGFDVFASDVKPAQIVAKLKQEGLDDFLTTVKKV